MEAPDKTWSSLLLELNMVSDSLSWLVLEVVVCDWLDVLELAEEFLEVLSLLMEELLDFLREFLLVGVSLVASALDDVGDVDDDEGGGTSVFLVVLFLEGSVGSHLTRAAFVERLESVLGVPRLKM